ncbi:DNA-deoxyinosine glycosylase [Methanoregula formicica]|uniref:G:T/U mismatch-specific DNA glycosylase n=1 Tax=Methanoregula formicica (strain DSM 22288 / NBRC 105244 / SMSP) TaxID=593750 RepID=L0HCR4_METFS|nr:DNA-deoxyinosine glycosylase [Methanoregula formicica]AGB01586.1 G:T/U mismatch-specific DNA glycosylase [Methanoregula formicica SMSP]
MPCSGLLPVSSPNPRVLILGSFPSVLSLERQEYYGNPKNQFWAVMELLFSVPSSLPYPERIALLTTCGIALWDVVASCERPGSADSRIRKLVPNNIAGFVQKHPSILMVALNGSTAGRLYHRWCEVPNLPCVALPSTSPAYAAMPFPEKVLAWEVLKKDI